MGIKDQLKSRVADLLIERPARKLAPTGTPAAELVTRLEETGRQIEQRLAQAGGTPANRRQLRHVIGIERWGQARLRVALGDPLVMDEYDDYRPAPALDWGSLLAEFRAARQDTIALAQQLEKAGASDVCVPHNDFGDLSARGWLYYLTMHARLESWPIRGRPSRQVPTSQAVIQVPLAPWLNVFALRGEGEGVVLVDAGLEGQAKLILERLAEHAISAQDIRLILITHGHTDHYGSAAELRELTGAPVAVHSLEAESLRGGAHLPDSLQPANKLVDVLMRVPGLQVPALEPDIVFEEEWRLDDYGVAGRVIPTPGHSPGSISVLLDSGEVIVGDTVMGRLMGLLPWPGPPLIVWDPERNQESIRQLADLSPRAIYASHGGPFKDLSGPDVDWRGVWIGLGILAGLVLAWRLVRRKQHQVGTCVRQ